MTLPPLRGAQYPGEPTSYVMEDRIWDYVGPGWGLEIFGYNLQGVARDPNAFQGIYLISPEGYPFFLHKLRTDFSLEVVHWDPTERKAWINRCSGDGPGCQTVEFDMVPGDAIEAWVVDGGTAVTADDVIYRATLPGGTIVWEDLGNDYTDAIMTRVPGGPTVVVSALGPATGDSYGGLAGQFWLDMERGIAYLRTDTEVTEGDSYHFDSAWSTVDLSTGAVTPLATVAEEAVGLHRLPSGVRHQSRDARREMPLRQCSDRRLATRELLSNSGHKPGPPRRLPYRPHRRGRADSVHGRGSRVDAMEGAGERDPLAPPPTPVGVEFGLSPSRSARQARCRYARTMSENDGVLEPPSEAPIRRSVMGTGAQQPFPTEVGAPRLPASAQQAVAAPTAAAAGGSPPVSRRAWFAYAGAFVVALGLIVGLGIVLRGGGDTPSPGGR